jgi:hypothetical protein
MTSYNAFKRDIQHRLATNRNDVNSRGGIANRSVYTVGSTENTQRVTINGKEYIQLLPGAQSATDPLQLAEYPQFRLVTSTTNGGGNGGGTGSTTTTDPTTFPVVPIGDLNQDVYNFLDILSNELGSRIFYFLDSEAFQSIIYARDVIGTENIRGIDSISSNIMLGIERLKLFMFGMGKKIAPKGINPYLNTDIKTCSSTSSNNTTSTTSTTTNSGCTGCGSTTGTNDQSINSNVHNIYVTGSGSNGCSSRCDSSLFPEDVNIFINCLDHLIGLTTIPESSTDFNLQVFQTIIHSVRVTKFEDHVVSNLGAIKPPPKYNLLPMILLLIKIDTRFFSILYSLNLHNAYRSPITGAFYGKKRTKINEHGICVENTIVTNSDVFNATSLLDELLDTILELITFVPPNTLLDIMDYYFSVSSFTNSVPAANPNDVIIDASALNIPQYTNSQDNVDNVPCFVYGYILSFCDAARQILSQGLLPFPSDPANEGTIFNPEYEPTKVANHAINSVYGMLGILQLIEDFMKSKGFISILSLLFPSGTSGFPVTLNSRSIDSRSVNNRSGNKMGIGNQNNNCKHYSSYGNYPKTESREVGARNVGGQNSVMELNRDRTNMIDLLSILLVGIFGSEPYSFDKVFPASTIPGYAGNPGEKIQINTGQMYGIYNKIATISRLMFGTNAPILKPCDFQFMFDPTHYCDQYPVPPPVLNDPTIDGHPVVPHFHGVYHTPYDNHHHHNEAVPPGPWDEEQAHGYTFADHIEESCNNCGTCDTCDGTRALNANRANGHQQNHTKPEQNKLRSQPNYQQNQMRSQQNPTRPQQNPTRPQQNQMIPQQNQMRPSQQNQMIPQQNQMRPQQNQMIPSQQNQMRPSQQKANSETIYQNNRVYQEPQPDKKIMNAKFVQGMQNNMGFDEYESSPENGGYVSRHLGAYHYHDPYHIYNPSTTLFPHDHHFHYLDHYGEFHHDIDGSIHHDVDGNIHHDVDGSIYHDVDGNIHHDHAFSDLGVHHTFDDRLQHDHFHEFSDLNIHLDHRFSDMYHHHDHEMHHTFSDQHHDHFHEFSDLNINHEFSDLNINHEFDDLNVNHAFSDLNIYHAFSDLQVHHDFSDQQHYHHFDGIQHSVNVNDIQHNVDVNDIQHNVDVNDIQMSVNVNDIQHHHDVNDIQHNLSVQDIQHYHKQVDPFQLDHKQLGSFQLDHKQVDPFQLDHKQLGSFQLDHKQVEPFKIEHQVEPIKIDHCVGVDPVRVDIHHHGQQPCAPGYFPGPDGTPIFYGTGPSGGPPQYPVNPGHVNASSVAPIWIDQPKIQFMFNNIPPGRLTENGKIICPLKNYIEAYANYILTQYNNLAFNVNQNTTTNAPARNIFDMVTRGVNFRN